MRASCTLFVRIRFACSLSLVGPFWVMPHVAKGKGNGGKWGEWRMENARGMQGERVCCRPGINSAGACAEVAVEGAQAWALRPEVAPCPCPCQVRPPGASPAAAGSGQTAGTRATWPAAHACHPSRSPFRQEPASHACQAERSQRRSRWLREAGAEAPGYLGAQRVAGEADPGAYAGIDGEEGEAGRPPLAAGQKLAERALRAVPGGIACGRRGLSRVLLRERLGAVRGD